MNLMKRQTSICLTFIIIAFSLSLISIDATRADTIIDNTDIDFSTVGTWPTSTFSPGFFGTNYQYAAPGNGSLSAIWSFDISTAGEYEIYAQWTTADNRASDAPYTVFNNGVNLGTFSVDQRINGGQFNLLGTVTADAGTLEVVLNDVPSGYVIADAVQIVRIDQVPGGVIFADDFNDGDASGWTVVDEGSNSSDWQVINGMYTQLNIPVDKFLQSFHLGSYSYYENGLSLNNYQLEVRITPLAGVSSVVDTVGVMFRYQDTNNYYRFSISRTQGFSRLEKKVNGSFTALAFNGRGFNPQQSIDVIIIVKGSKILVYVDGEPLFSVIDSSLSSGSVALFTGSVVEFDDVVISQNTLDPQVIISQPTSFSIEANDSGSPSSFSLQASAVATNVPSGGGVRFVLNNSISSTDFAEPYSAQFSSVSQGDHTVEAVIVDSSGSPVSFPMAEDVNVKMGTGGKYFIAMGDSITNGTGDDFTEDNDSVDGRNLSRGFTPILNDLLSADLNQPITVINEGLGGTRAGSRSGNGVERLDSTLERYPESQFWLILFGTNDSGGSLPTPSGVDCTESDFQVEDPNCIGTYKESMRSMILDLIAFGKEPLLSKVPFIANAPQSRDQLIQEYNMVVDQLVVEHGIPVNPPDLYSYFMQNPDELPDNIHPDGNGYISIANLWFDALMQSGILNQ